MKYAAMFLLLTVLTVYVAFTTTNRVLCLAALWLAVSFGGLGLAYALGRPWLLFKHPQGRLHPASHLFYWPYHGLNSLALGIYRRARRENAFDEIVENVYLGCRLGKADTNLIESAGFRATLDLTCEFSEIPTLRKGAYLCIPLLDTAAPTIVQLDKGARWIKDQAAWGPVYVHCAMGHGRSAAFVAAYLLLAGQAHSAEEAEQYIKTKRPRVGLNRVQRQALLLWHGSLN